MISEADRSTIALLARRYNLQRVLLFGSGADPRRESNDIDLGVEELPSDRFFEFYGDLIFSVSKPVDLVDLSQNSKFTRLIQREGVSLYVDTTGAS